MKRLPLLAIILFVAACGGPKVPANQQKAEVLVTDYIKKGLKAPASYQSMQFDTLREERDHYTTAEPEGRRLSALATALADSSIAYKKKSDNEMMTKAPNMKLLIAYHLKDSIFAIKSDSISSVIAQKSNGYVGKKITYVINHTYKVNNSLGNLTQHTTTFWINSDLTKVEHAQEAK